MEEITWQISELVNGVGKVGVIDLGSGRELYDKGVSAISYNSTERVKAYVHSFDRLVEMADVKPSFRKKDDGKIYSNEAYFVYRGIEFITLLDDDEYKKVVATTTTKESNDT